MDETAAVVSGSSLWASSAVAPRIFFACKPGNPAADDKCRATAAFSLVDEDGIHRTVAGAGAALHTAATIDNLGLVVGSHDKYPVRADGNAHTAADADFFIEFEDSGIFKISKGFHLHILGEKWCREPECSRCKGQGDLEDKAATQLEFHTGERGIGG